MAHISNENLLARYYELINDDASSDAALGAVVAELESRSL